MAAKLGRRGQTTVEYVLTTIALLFVFVYMYNWFGKIFMPIRFKAAAKIIMDVYTVTY